MEQDIWWPLNVWIWMLNLLLQQGYVPGDSILRRSVRFHNRQPRNKVLIMGQWWRAFTHDQPITYLIFAREVSTKKHSIIWWKCSKKCISHEAGWPQNFMVPQTLKRGYGKSTLWSRVHSSFHRAATMLSMILVYYGMTRILLISLMSKTAGTFVFIAFHLEKWCHLIKRKHLISWLPLQFEEIDEGWFPSQHPNGSKSGMHQSLLGWPSQLSKASQYLVMSTTILNCISPLGRLSQHSISCDVNYNI